MIPLSRCQYQNMHLHILFHNDSYNKPGDIMLKEKIIQSTIILMIGGFITKIFGMFIRIVMTRLIGIEGMSIYMLIYPTFALFMTLSQLSFPTSISKLVSENRHNNLRLVSSTIPLSLLLNIFLMLIIFLFAKPIAYYLLQDTRCYLPILAIALVLPFDSLSNLLRGYFFGKEKMIPHVISHIFEQIVRLTLIVIIIPTLVKLDLIYAVSFLVLVNLISEALSIFILFLFLPKNITIKKEDFKPNKKNLKDVLSISLPTTGSRLIGNIGMFLEPILLTSALTIVGLSQKYIQAEYAIITGYVLPILLLPGFFTGAISSAILPQLTQSYIQKNINNFKRKLKLGCLLSLLIGIPVTIFLILFPEFLLKIFYHTTLGTNYLKILAPFFLLYYLESPFASALQAMDKSKNIMIDNLLGTVIKSLSIFLFAFLNLGIYTLVIGNILNVAIITIRHFLAIKKELST